MLQHLQALKKSTLNPVYYFHGNESFLIDEATAVIKEKILLTSKNPEINRFNCEEHTIGEIVECIQTYPMFSGAKFIIIKHFESLSAAAYGEIEKCLLSPLTNVTIVIHAEKADMRKKFFKQLGLSKSIFQFNHPYDNQVPTWINYICKKHGKEIDSDGITFLQNYVGTSLQELNNELLKTSIFVAERLKITLSDVEEVVCQTKLNTIFGFLDALGNRRLGVAMKGVSQLMESGTSEILIATMVIKHFRNLLIGKEIYETSGDKEKIKEATGIHPFFLDNFISQLKKQKLPQLKKHYQNIQTTDLKLKSTNVDKRIMMERLVMQLCE